MDTLLSAPVPVKRARRNNPYTDIDLHRRSSAWPASTPPIMTGEEAVRAAKRLWRRFAGKAYPGKWIIEQGRGYANSDHLGFHIYPSQGWEGMVHSLSHRLYFSLVTVTRSSLTTAKARENYKHVKRFDTAGRNIHHSDAHAELERAMIKMVVDNGWLDGRLHPKPRAPRPKKPAPDPLQVELDRVVARRKAWKTRLRRAKTTLATLAKREAYLKRKIAKTIRFTLD